MRRYCAKTKVSNRPSPSKGKKSREVFGTLMDEGIDDWMSRRAAECYLPALAAVGYYNAWTSVSMVSMICASVCDADTKKRRRADFSGTAG